MRPQHRGEGEEGERGLTRSLARVDRAICGERSGPRGWLLLMPSQQQNPFARSSLSSSGGTVLFGSVGRADDMNGMACSDGHKRAHEIREFHTQGKGRSAGVQCACTMSSGCNTFPCLFRPKLHHHPIKRLALLGPRGLGERGPF